MTRDYDSDGVPLSGPWPEPEGDADALTRPQPAVPADAVRCFPALRDDGPYARMARHARPSPTPADGTRLDLVWRPEAFPPPPPPRKQPRSLPAGLALALAVVIVALSALASYAVASRRATAPARAPATVCVHVDRETGFVKAITLPPCTGSARVLVIP